MDRFESAALDRHVTGDYGEDSVPAGPRHPEIEVRLSGTDGNAIMVIGAVSRALRRGGVPDAEVSAFTVEAMSGDYDNVIQTAMRWVNVS